MSLDLLHSDGFISMFIEADRQTTAQAKSTTVQPRKGYTTINVPILPIHTSQPVGGIGCDKN